MLVPLEVIVYFTNQFIEMAGTRKSARQATMPGSSPSSFQNKLALSTGTKRKADSKSAPKAKRGKKGENKEQTTIEASMPSNAQDGDDHDVDMKDEAESKPAEGTNGVDKVAKRKEDVRDQENVGEEKQDEADTGKEEPKTNGAAHDESKEEPKKNGFDALMDQGSKNDDKNLTEEGTGSKISAADNAIENSSKREEATPSSILEKGIIYFFFRGRVGINEPSNVNEIARSYIVLRPMPHGAKLGQGPIGDDGNVRMLSLPKKVLPVSPKDRFMTFVEKANASMEDGMYLSKTILQTSTT